MLRSTLRSGILSQCNRTFHHSIAGKVKNVGSRNVSQMAQTDTSTFRSSAVLSDLTFAALPITALSSMLLTYSWYHHILAEEQIPNQEEYEQRIKEVLAESAKNKDVTRLDRSGKAPIYRIVLTGGPCGGKSSSLSVVSDRLRSLGFRVFIVPEGATIIITGGGLWKNYGDLSYNQSLAFEGSLMKTKMALEDAFYLLAEATGEPSVIICDRGTMDTAAYLSREAWEVLCEEYRWNVMDLRDRRYDAVIHLTSAAIGAQKFYTTENNAARRESVEEAAKLDLRILEAWVGHPAVRIIDNSTDFADKLKRVVAQVCQVIGAPKPVNYKRKYLIEDGDSIPIPVRYEQFEVEFTYLIKAEEQPGDGYTFIKRRGQNGSYHYSYSVLREIPGDSHEKVILERMITGREFIALMKQSDPQRMTVKKKVKCFVFNNQYFTLNTFIEPNIGLSVLECEAPDPKQPLALPEWMKAGKEVTDESIFTTYQVAKHHSHPDRMVPPPK